MSEPYVYEGDPEAGSAPKRAPFRAGDIVEHRNGARWVLACDEEGGLVRPVGWPEMVADAADCVLVEAADDDQRLCWLREAAQSRRR